MKFVGELSNRLVTKRRDAQLEFLKAYENPSFAEIYTKSGSTWQSLLGSLVSSISLEIQNAKQFVRSQALFIPIVKAAISIQSDYCEDVEVNLFETFDVLLDDSSMHLPQISSTVIALHDALKKNSTLITTFPMKYTVRFIAVALNFIEDTTITSYNGIFIRFLNVTIMAMSECYTNSISIHLMPTLASLYSKNARQMIISLLSKYIGSGTAAFWHCLFHFGHDSCFSYGLFMNEPFLKSILVGKMEESSVVLPFVDDYLLFGLQDPQLSKSLLSYLADLTLMTTNDADQIKIMQLQITLAVLLHDDVDMTSFIADKTFLTRCSCVPLYFNAANASTTTLAVCCANSIYRIAEDLAIKERIQMYHCIVVKLKEHIFRVVSRHQCNEMFHYFVVIFEKMLSEECLTAINGVRLIEAMLTILSIPRLLASVELTDDIVLLLDSAMTRLATKFSSKLRSHIATLALVLLSRALQHRSSLHLNTLRMCKSLAYSIIHGDVSNGFSSYAEATVVAKLVAAVTLDSCDIFALNVTDAKRPESIHVECISAGEKIMRYVVAYVDALVLQGKYDLISCCFVIELLSSAGKPDDNLHDKIQRYLSLVSKHITRCLDEGDHPDYPVRWTGCAKRLTLWSKATAVTDRMWEFTGVKAPASVSTAGRALSQLTMTTQAMLDTVGMTQSLHADRSSYLATKPCVEALSISLQSSIMSHVGDSDFPLDAAFIADHVAGKRTHIVSAFVGRLSRLEEEDDLPHERFAFAFYFDPLLGGILNQYLAMLVRCPDALTPSVNEFLLRELLPMYDVTSVRRSTVIFDVFSAYWHFYRWSSFEGPIHAEELSSVTLAMLDVVKMLLLDLPKECLIVARCLDLLRHATIIVTKFLSHDDVCFISLQRVVHKVCAVNLQLIKQHLDDKHVITEDSLSKVVFTALLKLFKASLSAGLLSTKDCTVASFVTQFITVVMAHHFCTTQSFCEFILPLVYRYRKVLNDNWSHHVLFSYSKDEMLMQRYNLYWLFLGTMLDKKLPSASRNIPLNIPFLTKAVKLMLEREGERGFVLAALRDCLCALVCGRISLSSVSDVHHVVKLCAQCLFQTYWETFHDSFVCRDEGQKASEPESTAAQILTNIAMALCYLSDRCSDVTELLLLMLIKRNTPDFCDEALTFVKNAFKLCDRNSGRYLLFVVCCIKDFAVGYDVTPWLNVLMEMLFALEDNAGIPLATLRDSIALLGLSWRKEGSLAEDGLDEFGKKLLLRIRDSGGDYLTYASSLWFTFLVTNFIVIRSEVAAKSVSDCRSYAKRLVSSPVLELSVTEVFELLNTELVISHANELASCREIHSLLAMCRGMAVTSDEQRLVSKVSMHLSPLSYGCDNLQGSIDELTAISFLELMNLDTLAGCRENATFSDSGVDVSRTDSKKLCELIFSPTSKIKTTVTSIDDAASLVVKHLRNGKVFEMTMALTQLVEAHDNSVTGRRVIACFESWRDRTDVEEPAMFAFVLWLCDRLIAIMVRMMPPPATLRLATTIFALLPVLQANVVSCNGEGDTCVCEVLRRISAVVIDCLVGKPDAVARLCSNREVESIIRGSALAEMSERPCQHQRMTASMLLELGWMDCKRNYRMEPSNTLIFDISFTSVVPPNDNGAECDSSMALHYSNSEALFKLMDWKDIDDLLLTADAADRLPTSLANYVVEQWKASKVCNIQVSGICNGITSCDRLINHYLETAMVCSPLDGYRTVIAKRVMESSADTLEDAKQKYEFVGDLCGHWREIFIAKTSASKRANWNSLLNVCQDGVKRNDVRVSTALLAVCCHFAIDVSATAAAKSEWSTVESEAVDVIKLADAALKTLKCDVKIDSMAIEYLAKYGEERYRRLEEHCQSADFQRIVQLAKKSRTEIKDVKAWYMSLNPSSSNDAKTLNPSSRMNQPPAAAPLPNETKRSINKYLLCLSNQCTADEQMVQKVEAEQLMLLDVALRCYSYALSSGGGRKGRKFYDDRVHRLVDLWFSLVALTSDTSGFSPAYEDVAVHLEAVPVGKLIPVVNQLVSRLNTGHASFSEHLIRTLGRLAVKHPFVALPVLLPQYLNDGDDVDKIRKARVGQILTQLSVENEEIKKKMTDYKHLIAAYGEVARLGNPKSDRQTLPATSKLCQLRDLVVPPLASGWRASACGMAPVPTLVSFAREHTILGGLNRPRLITYRLSDGSTQRQIVKPNDDLRQDAITQQLFAYVNNLLSASNRSGLYVRTYAVAPIKPTLGVIEFCADATSLGGYLLGDDGERGARKRYKPNDMAPRRARQLISDASKSDAAGKRKAFVDVCRCMTPVLRYFAYEKASSLNEVSELRRNFAESNAVDAIVGHVVGLGDRHCQNILIDKRLFRSIQIDLGIAFDQGRQLPVPEKVPFRLTREVLDGMGSTQYGDVFLPTARTVLEMIVEEKLGVLSILNVLTSDPLYHWTLPARKLMEQNGGTRKRTSSGDMDTLFSGNESSLSNDNNVAERAMVSVRQKLNLIVNCSRVTPQRYVKYLVDEAVSVDNLCGMFAGWQAYL